MREPSLRTSRLAIAGGLIAAIVIGGAGFVLGRSTASSEPPPPAVIRAPMPTPTPTPVSLPVPQPMDRAGIIALADAAADALAAGKPLPDSVSEAAGRRFTLRFPFGCDGPAPEKSRAPLRWRYDAEKGALRLHVAPVSWQAGEWWRHGNAPDLEAIEGFWITHPWTSSEACPAGGGAAPGFEAVTLPGQTLAIAQFFTAGTSRQALRDGDPFETVLSVRPQELRAGKGFRVRLTGKIDRVPGNGPVRCIQPAGIEQRPICVVAASLDNVAIENAATGDTLATWTIGSSRPTPP